MDDTAADFGELIFSLLISYIGALEFFFILRHLCHFSGRHADCNEFDAESLQKLKEKLQRQLADASDRENQAGTNVMQDGVPYTNGFRVDPDQVEIDRLKGKIDAKDAKDKRRAEIEAELARQKQIEEETRKQLEQAEAELARQRAAKAAEEERNRQQQQEIEKQKNDIPEEAENFRRLLEAEKQREAEQRTREEQAEKEKQAKQEHEANLALRKRDEVEAAQKLLEAERRQEAAERKLEEEEDAKNAAKAAEKHSKGNKLTESEAERKLLAAPEAKQFEDSHARSQSEKFLETEPAYQKNDQQLRKQQKQQVIEENARKFLEAEHEMVQLQQKMLESAHGDNSVPVIEEPMIKRTHRRVEASAVPGEHLMQTTVKTQFGQGNNESFTLSSKPIVFPSISDDGSSNEPHSSKQSSFSTQPSDEMTTGNEEIIKSMVMVELQTPQHERQEPDGEDNNTPSVQYTEDYLRSLDGLKSRPLLREDGSGRRRAFKKRRSSGSSNSSRDSRTSRDEELKMFTSLEEEEFRKASQKGGDEDFTPIKYTNEPTLKVKGHHHHRRHKRSPAKDMKTVDDSLRTSLERLGEEGSNPWGEVVPEHYKNTEFWQREKAMSIDEEEVELETTAKSDGTHSIDNAINNKPNSSSFEEATVQQNNEAISTLRKQQSKDPVEQKESSGINAETTTTPERQTNKNKDANLQSSREAEDNASPSSASASPRLRRSPRIDEMDQYEERWIESVEKPAAKPAENLDQLNSPTTPTIAIHAADDDVAAWRDAHGLMMQGLSDFYDFTASVNRSRSRSTSRNASPANSKPSTPQPRNMPESDFNRRQQRVESDASSSASSTFNIYDDSGNLVDVEAKNIAAFIKSFHDDYHTALDPVESHISTKPNVQNTILDECKSSTHNDGNSIPSINVESNECKDINEMNRLIDDLRSSQLRSRSRSRSPLPTAANIERSLETRRSKLVRQNDEILENLSKSPNEIDLASKEEIVSPAILVEGDGDESEDITSGEMRNEMNQLVDDLRSSQLRSRSRSRSPLPTAANIERSLETRRSKLVRQNDEILENLSKSPNEIDLASKEEIVSLAILVEGDGDESEDITSGEMRNEMNQLVDYLRSSQLRSRSRSRSPLPTAANIERNLETRRSRLIKQNDEVFEKLSKHSKDEDSSNAESSKDDNAVPKISIDSYENDKREGETTPEMRNEMNQLVESIRKSQLRSRSRSRSPLPTAFNIERSLEARKSRLIKQNDEIFENFSKPFSPNSDEASGMDHKIETPNMPKNILKPNDYDQSLDRRRSSRSRSPLPTRDNIERSLEIRRNKLIQQNQELLEKPIDDLDNESEFPPTITVDYAEEASSDDDSDCRENVASLVASLRVSRSRSRSKSPMRLPNAANLNESISNRREKLIELNDQFRENLKQRSLCPEKPRLIVEYRYEIEEASEDTEDPISNEEETDPHREKSQTQSPSLSDNNFHRMLNLESSHNRTLAKDTEEWESIMAEKQRDLDKEALHKLKTANEETELRTLTPSTDRKPEADEECDMLHDLQANERLRGRSRIVPTSPITPDFDRTISEEWRDFQRIKKDMLSSGFKRSKYVGESMEFGNEYEQLRREAAAFRRSKSPSPSVEESVEKPNKRGDFARQTAAERRQIQDEILKELIESSSNDSKREVFDRHGAKPKDERRLSDEYLRSLSKEIQDTVRIKKDPLNSGLQRESVDNSHALMQYEEMRREMVEFRRSRSCSRSPVDERDNEDLIAIEIESAKRELQDQILDKLSMVPINFQDFSRHLNADFLDDRRASDSALMHKPEMSIKSRDNNYELDMDPEEYHHYRRFSLNQEQQIEEYPNDDDFIYMSQIEVRTLDGTRTWIKEDYYSASRQEDEESPTCMIVHVDQEEETEDSDDERQTVVEVEDEIDTDICDFNERGPTDESHHEQSECEEADRAVDHYANRGATDWQSVSDLNDIQNAEEGAVGGRDSDSFEIDQIYDEAIKNRKQSGILREYDSILLEMQNNYQSNPDNNAEEEKEEEEAKNDQSNDTERYALWAKTRNLERCGGTRKLSVTFMETEKHETELRYLGDASTTARQSTRLRSRYGYVPQSKGDASIEDIEVNVDYKPKREYNWRKNFKLDDDDNDNDEGDGDDVQAFNGSENMMEEENSTCENNGILQEFEDNEDNRKFSLGGESITLYSRSPDRLSPDIMLEEAYVEAKQREDPARGTQYAESNIENKEHITPHATVVVEKPKKKKSKKKSHRESKESIEKRYKDEDDDDDEDDSDSQVYFRRSSSRQLETESPKRKSRSRRGSRSSNDSSTLFSPRSSLVPGDSIEDNAVPGAETTNEPTKKKVKKRKKAKDVFSVTENIKEEHEQANEEVMRAVTMPSTTCSEPLNLNERSNDSISVNSDSRSQVSAATMTMTRSAESTTTTSTTSPNITRDNTVAPTASSSSIDSFDILKDANFYPLF